MPRLFFFGDSLVAGKWDNSGGWVGRLSSLLMNENISRAKEKFECLPYNLGVHGNCVADVVNRMESEIKARTPLKEITDRKIQIILSVGIKNSLQEDEIGFEREIQDLLRQASSFTDYIQVIGLPPVNEERLIELRGKPYKNKSIFNLEKIISKVCAELDIPFIPIFERLKSEKDYIISLIDGLHPDPSGHAMLAQILMPLICNKEFYLLHSSQ